MLLNLPKMCELVQDNENLLITEKSIEFIGFKIICFLYQKMYSKNIIDKCIKSSVEKMNEK